MDRHQNKEYSGQELHPLYTNKDVEKVDSGFTVSTYEDTGHDDSDSNSDQNTAERETWGRGIEFILSLLGYAVGLGNLWRFPYLCMRNGGGAFLFPFIICVLTCGLPLFFLEVSLGQFLGRSSLHAWFVFPLFKGLGIGMIIINIVFVLYYNMIMAWTLFYLGNSFQKELPWTRCDGWWNTDDCFSYANVTSAMTNVTVKMGNLSVVIANSTMSTTTNLSDTRISSEEEFWQNKVLQISSGLGDFGSMPWHLVVCLLGAWVIVFLCIMKGVKSIGKVIYVTALLPYVLLTILLVRGLTLDGSVDGIVYYLKPDIGKMMRAQVWVEAALQVFFSLGPGWGPIISMASYNNFNNNGLRDAVVISLIGEGTSIFCGFVVFTILGFIAKDLNLPIEEVVKSGPGLAFVAYPQALSKLPVPQLWSVLFFFMLLLVGLDSQFSSVESVVAGLVDLFPRMRRRRTLITLIACAVGFIIGLPFCLQGGMYLFQLVDWYVAIFAIPLFGFIECFLLAWVYGAERYSRDIEMMMGRGLPLFLRLCWSFVTPGALTICLIFTLATYKPPNYGDYNYPVAGQVFGWCIAVIPLLPLVVAAMHELLVRRGVPFGKRLTQSVQPTDAWKPHSAEYEKTYSYRRYTYDDMPFHRRVLVNLLGDRN